MDAFGTNGSHCAGEIFSRASVDSDYPDAIAYKREKRKLNSCISDKTNGVDSTAVTYGHDGAAKLIPTGRIDDEICTDAVGQPSNVLLPFRIPTIVDGVICTKRPRPL
ncbi:hypothetical protein X778_10150 [Pseudomonas aeruginosa VRFPA07]|nr:hypothetical protein X778_10150 [Pseudomonas aeruginosa VRFPA07]